MSINQISLFVKKVVTIMLNSIILLFNVNGCFCPPFSLLCPTVLLLGGVAVIWTLSLSRSLLSIHNDRKLPTKEWVWCLLGLHSDTRRMFQIIQSTNVEFFEQ